MEIPKHKDKHINEVSKKLYKLNKYMYIQCLNYRNRNKY